MKIVLKYFFVLSLLFVKTLSAQTIEYTLLVGDSECSETNNGIIEIDVTSANSPYTYLWNTGETTNKITGLRPGNYSVTIKDASNNDTIVQVTVRA